MSETLNAPTPEDRAFQSETQPDESVGGLGTAGDLIAKHQPDNPPVDFNYGTPKPEQQPDSTSPHIDTAVALPQPGSVDVVPDELATVEATDALARTQQETALVHSPDKDGDAALAVRTQTQEQLAPTPEQQEKQRIDYAEKIAKEIREREEQRMIERYGEGKIGKMKWWLNETDAGRAVKIGGKIAVGTAAAIAAGTLTGGIGLLAAPMVYSLGLKTAVDGGIEAVQYLSKGRNLRLQVEGAKGSLLTNLGEDFRNLDAKLSQGEITQQQYNSQVGTLIRGITEQEKAVIAQEQSKDVWEKKQAKLRAVVSSVAAVGIGMVTGVPLGMQDFDRDGISHAVRFGRHGFNFLYNATEMMGHAGGAVGHTLGHAIDARAYAGLGLAVAGLCLKTASELKSAASRGEITSPDPKYLDLIPQETALARVDPQTGLERMQAPPENPSNPQQPPQAETASPNPLQPERSQEKELPSVKELIENTSIPIDDFKKFISNKEDARKLVGLQETYTRDQFKKAKREFAKSIHPDVNGSSPRCQELFKVVNPLLDQLESNALPNPENSALSSPTNETSNQKIENPDGTTHDSKPEPERKLEQELPELLESKSIMIGDHVIQLSEPYYTIDRLQEELKKVEKVRDAYRGTMPILFDEAERDINTLQKWIERKSKK